MEEGNSQEQEENIRVERETKVHNAQVWECERTIFPDLKKTGNFGTQRRKISVHKSQQIKVVSKKHSLGLYLDTSYKISIEDRL